MKTSIAHTYINTYTYMLIVYICVYVQVFATVLRLLAHTGDICFDSVSLPLCQRIAIAAIYLN